jgi:hypothetical protein
MYLLYPTEQDAWDRSEEEGIAQGLAYHTEGEAHATCLPRRRPLTASGHWT